MAPPQVGSQVAGYRIESLVGRGGMGVVYRARQPGLDRTVALKLIAPEALEDAEARERFVSEARLAAAIEHPNVVPIHAAGEADGVAYFVMRFVEGDDLRTRVRRDGPLASARAAEIAHGVGSALDAIHRAGLVHRDVKPANILLGAGDHVYLTDFGLARPALARGGTTSGRGHWAGSLHYAAPEQIRGGRVDARADVYALGCVLVFMLTGRVPFDRDSDEATLWAHVADPPPRPSTLRRGLPKAFDDVVARAMAKQPHDRFASAGDLGRAALAAAEGRRAPRRRGPVAQGAASPSGARPVAGLSDEAPTLTSLTATGGTPARPGRRRAVLAAAAAAVLALLAGGFALWAAGRGHGRANTPAGRATPTTTAVASASPTATPRPAGARPHVVATFRHVGRRPNALALVGRRLWVTSSHSPYMTRLDALTGRARTRTPVIGEGGHSVSVAGRTVWVADAFANEVLGVEAASGRIVRRWPTPGKWPIAVAAEPDGTVWVAIRSLVAGGPDTIAHYTATGDRLSAVEVPRGVTAIVRGGDFIWAAVARTAKIVRVDRHSGRMRTWARLIYAAHSLAWAGGYLWATSPDGNSLARIDPRVKNSQINTNAGHFPEGVAMAGGRLFVASYNDQSLLVIDPKSLKPAGPAVTVPFNPYAVVAAGRHVWVTGLGENTVTRVDLG
jgi:DNA-binding beta-propeller fold protein YncE